MIQPIKRTDTIANDGYQKQYSPRGTTQATVATTKKTLYDKRTCTEDERNEDARWKELYRIRHDMINNMKTKTHKK